MSTATAVVVQGPQRVSITAAMAERYGMDTAAFEQTLRATVMPSNTSKEQFAAFLLVAKEHNLNPVTREIYAMPAKGGGIQPIVSIDGWLNLMNTHPQMNGLEFEDEIGDDGKLLAITARIWRKDRERPICVTEYMAECRRDTPTWKQWPARMLRHKAAIQAARYAFGFAGIVEPDEYERSSDGVRMAPPAAPPRREIGKPAALPPPPPKTGAPPDAPASAPPAQRRAGPPSPPSAPQASLDLDADPQPSGEEKILNDLVADLAACGEVDTLDEVWLRFENVADDISRRGRETAAWLYEENRKRIRGA